jgi:hypothetical protein
MTPSRPEYKNLATAEGNPIANGGDTIDTAMGTDETLPPLLAALPQSKSVTRTTSRSPPLAYPPKWASIDVFVAAVTWVKRREKNCT